jgi:hypothetical protein
MVILPAALVASNGAVPSSHGLHQASAAGASPVHTPASTTSDVAYRAHLRAAIVYVATHAQASIAPRTLLDLALARAGVPPSAAAAAYVALLQANPAAVMAQVPAPRAGSPLGIRPRAAQGAAPLPQVSFSDSSSNASAENVVLAGDQLFVDLANFAPDATVTITVGGANSATATTLVDGSLSGFAYTVDARAAPGKAQLIATDGRNTVAEALIVGEQLNVTATLNGSAVTNGTLNAADSSGLYPQTYGLPDASGVAHFAVPPNTTLEIRGNPADGSHAPVVILITGKPGAAVTALFSLAGVGSAVQHLKLDACGYATVRYTPDRAPTTACTVHLAVTVQGVTDTQAVAASFTLVPGPAPRSGVAPNLVVAPAQGVVLGMFVAPSPAHSGQTVVTTVHTGPSAAVRVDVYGGSTRLAGGSGHADKQGTFLFKLDIRKLVPQQGKRTLIVKVAVQSGGHAATMSAALVVTR